MYRKSIYGDATTRLKFSNRNEVNQNAVDILGNQLERFFEATGLQPRGAQGLLPPKGMDENESRIFDDIIESFLDNSRGKQGIIEDFADLPTDEKAKSIKEKEEALNKAERVRSDERLHKEIYSHIIKEVFDLASENEWSTLSVYRAMTETLDQLDNGEIADDERAYVQSVIDKLGSGLY